MFVVDADSVMYAYLWSIGIEKMPMRSASGCLLCPHVPGFPL